MRVDAEPQWTTSLDQGLGRSLSKWNLSRKSKDEKEWVRKGLRKRKPGLKEQKQGYKWQMGLWRNTILTGSFLPAKEIPRCWYPGRQISLQQVANLQHPGACLGTLLIIIFLPSSTSLVPFLKSEKKYSCDKLYWNLVSQTRKKSYCPLH